MNLFGEEDRHIAGKKTAHVALPSNMSASAVFAGERGEYRLRLSREWDQTKPCVMFVMMNPSVADALIDDRTIDKCWRIYASRWGYGKMLIGNVFSYRCTDQKRLLETKDPIGPDNDRHLLEMASEASLIVMAYGTPHKSLQHRGPKVAKLLRDHGYKLHVLKLSKFGVPVHPLYLPEDLVPIPWEIQ